MTFRVRITWAAGRSARRCSGPREDAVGAGRATWSRWRPPQGARPRRGRRAPAPSDPPMGGSCLRRLVSRRIRLTKLTIRKRFRNRVGPRREQLRKDLGQARTLGHRSAGTRSGTKRAREAPRRNCQPARPCRQPRWTCWKRGRWAAELVTGCGWSCRTSGCRRASSRGCGRSRANWDGRCVVRRWTGLEWDIPASRLMRRDVGAGRAVEGRVLTLKGTNDNVAGSRQLQRGGPGGGSGATGDRVRPVLPSGADGLGPLPRRLNRPCDTAGLC